MLPAETTEITLGEVARKVDNLAGNVEKLAESISGAPNWRDFSALENRVKDLENWQTWALRIVLGFVIMGALAAVIVFRP